MRTFIVYLVIVALLVCPYDCAVKLAAAQSPANDDPAGCCEACQAHELSASLMTSDERLPAERDPSQPAPSEDGKSCLCEGAVFDVTARSPADAVLECSLLSWAAAVTAVPSLAFSAPSVEVDGPPLIHKGGRLTRIAIRSLLL
jgi:hypothetical protein